MSKILPLLFWVLSGYALKGQIKEWQCTNSFNDYQYTGTRSVDKRYVAQIVGRSIIVYDTQNQNKEIVAGLSNGQNGYFSDDSGVYITFMNDQISIRFLERPIEKEGIKYITTPQKIVSLFVHKDLVYCSFENGKISVYNWAKREQIDSFEISKNPITFIRQNTFSNSVILKVQNTGLLHWQLDTYKITPISDSANDAWFSENGEVIFYESGRSFYKFELKTGIAQLVLQIPKESWMEGTSEDSFAFGFAVNQPSTLLITFDYSLSKKNKYKPVYHIWNFREAKLVKTIYLNHKIFMAKFKNDSQMVAQLADMKTPETSCHVHLNDITNISKTIALRKTTTKNSKESISNTDKTQNFSHKIALVIGNSKYKFNDLKGIPVNDATDMAKKLEEMGFVVNYLHDASKIEINDILLKLGKVTNPVDAIVFFYAGHGIEVDGKNYLIPIDATLEKKGDVINETVALDNILAFMKALNATVNLVYLDACRNNPFRSWSRSSESLGFSEVEVNMPTMKVYYATQPGALAANGTGRNGVFTSALLKFLKKGIDCDELMRNVTKEVYNQSKQVQVPWQKGSLIHEFSF
jgi:hypothetical protein